jgi:hypothetical protein
VAKTEADIAGISRVGAALAQTTQSPARYAVNASASYVTGSHNVKVGLQRTWGTFFHTTDANADLYQNYRSASTGVPFSVPNTVTVRNTPVASGEALNSDLGIYAQDAWTIKRLTLNAGLRWEHVNAQVLEGNSPAGRFVPARTFPAVTDLPEWKDWAPRFALVFDVFGNAKTALKYSVNRYNAARTTGIADDYNPLASTTSSLAWTDLNRDGIAQGSSQVVNGVRQSCTYLTPGCEIDFRNLTSNFGVQSLNEYGNFPRTYNVEHGLELQHEVMPRLSLTGSWFHGSFSNLTATINRTLQFAGDPTRNPNYTPFTVFDPRDGSPITAYGLNVNMRSAPTSNLDTFDSNRENMYNAFNLEFRVRPGGGAQIFGGVAIERSLEVNCTAPDNPNSLRFCDDTSNDIPFRKSLKLAGSYPLPYGVTFSAVLQSNQPTPATSNTTTRNMTFTRGSTRYPATCPAPCPAGQIIGPTSVMGQSTLAIPLVPQSASFVERITQLDFKLSKTFRLNRVSVSPVLEMFNVNNSDAIISYQSVNVLSGAYEAPNSIMQPRMIGIGAQVKW